MSAPVIVLGAGPTGLSAAYHLGADALLVERARRVGGACRSVESGGFTFDLAGHIMFSNDPYVHELYRLLLGDNVHWQDREAWIYSKGVHTRYPFQGALYGLPNDVIRECIMGAVEARYGAATPACALEAAPANGNGSAKGDANGNGHRNGNGQADHSNGHQRAIEDCCADGILEAETRLGAPRHGSADPRDFEEFIYRVWGAGIAKHFAIPYNRKLWAVPLSEMETSWLGGRVPLPDLEEMIDGALSPVPKPMGPNARFGYPLRGGFQALMDAFVPILEGELRLGTSVERVSIARRQVTLSDGTTQPFEALVSTIPLPELIRRIGSEAPPEIREAAEGLRHVSVRCVNLGIGRPDLTEKHWIYYPEDTVFHRVFVQGNASPHCNPPGGFGLTCEITYSDSKPLPCDGEELTRRCLEECREVGLVRPEDPLWASCQTDLPYAYVVYDHGRKARVDRIRTWLLDRGIVLAGRFSEWAYYNSDHAFLAGRNAAQVADELRQRGGTGKAPIRTDRRRAKRDPMTL